VPLSCSSSSSLDDSPCAARDVRLRLLMMCLYIQVIKFPENSSHNNASLLKQARNRRNEA